MKLFKFKFSKFYILLIILNYRSSLIHFLIFSKIYIFITIFDSLKKYKALLIYNFYF